MKKEYKTPNLEIVNIQISQFLLEGSIPKGDDPHDPANAHAPGFRGKYGYEEDEEDEEEW